MPSIEQTFPYDVAGIGSVLAPEGVSGYRVQLLNGEVQAFPAASGEPCEANSLADLTAAIAALALPPVPVVPSPVTPLQVRRALNASGLRTQVEEALAAAPQDARDAWEFATEIKRDDATLNAMAAALGMSPAQIDDLFTLAATYS
jgi:hypothetical protein